MIGKLRSLVLCLLTLSVLALMYTQILPIIQERLSPAPVITGHTSMNTVPAVRATARIQNNLILTVKRASGETETIVKKGDPWTANLAKLILNMLLGGHYGGTKQPFTYTDGSTGTIFDTELLVYWNGATYGNPSFAIGIGNGTAPFSVNDYALANEVMLSDVPADYVSFNDNGTCYNINVTQSFTVSSDINVTEVGLFIKVDSDPGNSNTQKYLLLARDVLDSPITLYANDTISIQYVLYFPYGSQPFTKQFYGLLLNYFFCLRSLGTPISFKCTDGTSTSRNDFANDYKTGTYSSGDVATEHLYTWLGNGSSISWSFDNYTLLSKIGESPSDTPFSLTYNSTHAILSVTITYSFTSPTTITEVGFVIKDIDIDSTIDHNRKSVLILYFVLDNPVYVESGGTFKFKCEIVLPLAG